MVEENWIKVVEINRLNKLEENMEIYHPIEELLKENNINYKYKIEEGLNYDETTNIKGIKNIFFVNLYVESKNEKRVQQIIEEYEKANFVEEELLEELIDAEDEIIQKTIPAIILPYIYVILFGIIVIVLSFANFEDIISRIIGTVVAVIIIIYAIKSIIQKISERKK